ncbi:Beta-xylanase [Pyrenophora tritici-repentis]|nr:Beta-xylanase [Pyrenophora tritici-repentis]KAI1576252.1 XynA Beta-14-xylanase [Pyrenophora tritici-repentis]KAI2479522.1 Beta-xylanase [Pyrenophora tritici-repentis]
MHIPYLATALALTGLVAATPIEPRQAAQLNPAIRARGRSYVGTSLTIRNDATEQGIIKSTEFGSITPENAMKWDATEPSQGAFTFSSADAVANFATANNKEVCCLLAGMRTRGLIQNVMNSFAAIHWSGIVSYPAGSARSTTTQR